MKCVRIFITANLLWITYLYAETAPRRSTVLEENAFSLALFNRQMSENVKALKAQKTRHGTILPGVCTGHVNVILAALEESQKRLSKIKTTAERNQNKDLAEKSEKLIKKTDQLKVTVNGLLEELKKDSPENNMFDDLTAKSKKLISEISSKSKGLK